MSDQNRLDRREFVRRASAAVVGAVGLGSAGSARGPSESRSKPDADRSPRAEQGTGPDGGIDRFQMVLPDVDPLQATYANLAVVAGLPSRPGVRPPPKCFPEGVEQWQAYDALVVDLTETSFIGGDGNEVGPVVQARTYSARPLRFGRAYRVVGATPCDGYVRATVHDLADQIDVNIGANETGENSP